jgi:hypothetical protein
MENVTKFYDLFAIQRNKKHLQTVLNEYLKILRYMEP